MIDKSRLGWAVLIGALVVLASTAVPAPAPAAATSRPTVTGVSAAAGPLAGGNRVTVQGSGFRAGVRVWFGRRAGTHVHVTSAHRLTVVAPRHLAGWVHVRVRRDGATSRRRTADRYLFTRPPGPLVWGAARAADPLRAGVGDVSCPTTTFCLAVGEDGRYLTFNGKKWSAPRSMPAKSATAVSCPSRTTCTAVTAAGYVMTWTSGSWSTPRKTGSDWSDVSCPTVTFCLAISGLSDELATGHGDSWSKPATLKDVVGATADCTSATFCLLVDGNGVTETWNGTAWRPRRSAPGGSERVSCATATSCTAIRYVDGPAVVMTWNGTGWRQRRLATRRQLLDVDCASSTRCVVVGEGGSGWARSRTGWTAIPLAHRDWISVSCPAANRCVAVGGYQDASVLVGSSWSHPVVLEPVSGYPTDLSCATARSCVVVDNLGAAVVYADGHWGAPRQLLVPGALTAVACPTSTFCLAVGSRGRTVAWNGSRWSRPVAHAGFGTIDNVSCASSRSCVAVSGNRVLRWTPRGWSSSTIGSVTGGVAALACPTPTYCLAVTYRGRSVEWNGHRWSSPRQTLHQDVVQAVACPAARRCYVADAGDVRALHGTVWSGRYRVNRRPESVEDISCPSVTFCAALARYEDDFGVTERMGTFRGAAAGREAAAHPWTGVALSCPTTHTCLLLDDAGSVRVGVRK